MPTDIDIIWSFWSLRVLLILQNW